MNEENRDPSIHVSGVSSLVHMTEPRFRPQRRFVQESRHLPFGTGPARPVRLLSDAIVAPRKFHGVSNALQVYGNQECRAECGSHFCDIFKLPLLIQAQSIGDHYPTGNQGVGLCCSPSGVVLYGIPAFPERFNPSYHCTIWQRCATCFTQSLKSLFCTTTSCHFNFDPGTLF